jgi:hypothetical protein
LHGSSNEITNPLAEVRVPGGDPDHIQQLILQFYIDSIESIALLAGETAPAPVRREAEVALAAVGTESVQVEIQTQSH